MNRKFFLKLLGLSVISLPIGLYSYTKNTPYEKIKELRGAILASGRVNIASEGYKKDATNFSNPNINWNSRVAEDFRNGDVVNVSGWVLSRTECHYIVFIASI
jgi:hypothetical protein